MDYRRLILTLALVMLLAGVAGATTYFYTGGGGTTSLTSAVFVLNGDGTFTPSN